VRVHLDVRPTDAPYKPSVDELFRSAADVYNGRVLGVVMTGMGNDGTEGARQIKSRGGRILTESESSCVVYGMPRAVVEASLSDRAAPLPELSEAILEMLS
jgi:two-component system chemotaxis response regulator CheB